LVKKSGVFSDRINSKRLLNVLKMPWLYLWTIMLCTTTSRNTEEYGKPEEAIEFFDKYIEKVPNHPILILAVRSRYM